MYILREQRKSDTTDKRTQLLWLYESSFCLGVLKTEYSVPYSAYYMTCITAAQSRELS